MQNNEKIEKKLISLILESSKYSYNLSEKYLTNTKKLFESVYFPLLYKLIFLRLFHLEDYFLIF